MRSVLASIVIGPLLLSSSLCYAQLPPNSLEKQDSKKWEGEISAFEARDRTNPPPKNCIVFVGSSSIRMWSTLQADFPGLPVVNRGFGGSELADSVHFAERIIFPYSPREVVIYAGANDLAGGKSPELVYGDFVALVAKLRKHEPQVRIVFIATAPNPKRWAIVDKMRRFNDLARDYSAQHDVTFVDVFPIMLGQDGLPKPGIYRDDGLHMNAAGYELWKAALTPYVK
jgi:lysophospholipase L1-like esterase